MTWHQVPFNHSVSLRLSQGGYLDEEEVRGPAHPRPAPPCPHPALPCSALPRPAPPCPRGTTASHLQSITLQTSGAAGSQGQCCTVLGFILCAKRTRFLAYFSRCAVRPFFERGPCEHTCTCASTRKRACTPLTRDGDLAVEQAGGAG